MIGVFTPMPRVVPALGLALVLGLGCTKAGSNDEAEPRGQAAKTPTEKTSVPDDAALRRDDAQALSAAAYWKAVALQQIVDQQVEGDTLWLEVGKDGDSRPAKVEQSALQDAEARNRGYREAVDELVTRLHGVDAAGQAEAVAHLRRLTKTERGGPHAWMDWHDESGDFLVWNATLERVDLDTEAQRQSRPEAIDGLRLWAKLDRERYKIADRIELILRLENAHAKSGCFDNFLWVNRRLAIGADLQIEVRHHGRNDIAALPLVEAQPAPPPKEEHFVSLDGTQSVDRRIDLSALLEDPTLPPGRYAIDVRYINTERGEGFGLQPTERSKDLPGGGPAWTGELESVTLLFEVVPW